jgi:hypothetical protein
MNARSPPPAEMYWAGLLLCTSSSRRLDPVDVDINVLIAVARIMITEHVKLDGHDDDSRCG